MLQPKKDPQDKCLAKVKCHDQSSCFFLQDILLLHFDAAKSHLPRCLICLEEFADGDELKTSLGGGGPDFCFSEGRI